MKRKAGDGQRTPCQKVSRLVFPGGVCDVARVVTAGRSVRVANDRLHQQGVIVAMQPDDEVTWSKTRAISIAAVAFSPCLCT